MEDGNGCIQRLPEECIAYILSFTSPRDACQAAAASAAFCAAAASNGVCERFLPPDYQQILPRAVYPVPAASKKELFLRLSDSIHRPWQTEFCVGKIKREEVLYVVCEGVTYYLGRYSAVLEVDFFVQFKIFGGGRALRCICWLEIQGKIDATMLSPSTTYAAFLVFKLVHGSQNLTLPAQQAYVKVGGILVSYS